MSWMAMKKFKYKAEAYLRVLDHQKDQALRNLKRAERQRQALIEKFHWMEAEMKKSFKVNEKFGQGESNLHLVNDNNQFIQLLKMNMLEVSNQIAIAEDEYAKKYKALMDLRLKAKKVELHKENEHKKYRKERRKLEQKQTDEINGTRKRGLHAESI